MNLKNTTALSFFVALNSILGLTEAKVDKIIAIDENTRIEQVQTDIVKKQKLHKKVKVALQAGHWKNDELPEELYMLRGQTGAQVGDLTEWETNLQIANKVKLLLEDSNVEVEILPATVPSGYKADLFVSIHADGSENEESSGFMVGTPYQDLTGLAGRFAKSIEIEYKKETKLPVNPEVTANMRGYYAFAWWDGGNYTIHPYTPALLIETGYLTSKKDREIIVDKQDIAAKGIANGIIKSFKSLQN